MGVAKKVEEDQEVPEVVCPDCRETMMFASTLGENVYVCYCGTIIRLIACPCCRGRNVVPFGTSAVTLLQCLDCGEEFSKE
jgi:uncharacterized protein YbaR (Trm112 family)